MRTCFWVFVLAVVAVAAGGTPARADFIGFPTGYREPEHGDLSDVGGHPATGGGAPTSLTAMIGSNTLVANNNADPLGDPLPDLDYFAVTIPEGLMLDRIILLSFATGEPNGTLAFLGVQAGTAFTEPPSTVDNPAGPNVANLLGWAHFGDKTDADGNPDPANTPPGTDLLALMGAGEGAIGFTPSLQSGTYTFWLQETGPFSSVYAFDFQVTPVPEPTSLSLVTAGLGTLAAVGYARWRRSGLKATQAPG